MNTEYQKIIERGNDDPDFQKLFFEEQCLSEFPWKCDATVARPEVDFEVGITEDHIFKTTKGVAHLIDNIVGTALLLGKATDPYEFDVNGYYFLMSAIPDEATTSLFQLSEV